MCHRLSRAVALAIVITALAGCASTSTQSGTGEWFDDSWITTKVKTELVAAPGVSSTEINVETFRGVVQLSGFAGSQAEIDKAVKAAQGVTVVKSVKNEVKLRARQ